VAPRAFLRSADYAFRAPFASDLVARPRARAGMLTRRTRLCGLPRAWWIGSVPEVDREAAPAAVHHSASAPAPPSLLILTGGAHRTAQVELTASGPVREAKSARHNESGRSRQEGDAAAAEEDEEGKALASRFNLNRSSLFAFAAQKAFEKWLGRNMPHLG